MKNILSPLLAGAELILLVLIVFAISIGFTYLLVMGIFWAFGPSILGYTFGIKTVMGIWFVSLILGSIFRRAK